MHSVFHQNCPPYLRDVVEFVNNDPTKRRLRSATTRTAATVYGQGLNSAIVRSPLQHRSPGIVFQTPTALTSHRLPSIPKAAKTFCSNRLLTRSCFYICFPPLFLYFYMYIGGLQMLCDDDDDDVLIHYVRCKCDCDVCL